jgi:hypothetical protein
MEGGLSKCWFGVAITRQSKHVDKSGIVRDVVPYSVTVAVTVIVAMPPADIVVDWLISDSSRVW